MNITNTTQQRALLLYQVGQHTQEIFDSFPNNGEDDDYDTALQKLDEYFLPKKNVTYEVFQFRQAVQHPNETIDQYATRLRKLAEHCEFADTDSEIFATIIQHCSSTRLRRYALREDDLTLDTLLPKARAMEASETQARGIETSLNLPAPGYTTTDSAHFIKNRIHPSASASNLRQRHRGNNSAANQCGKCGYLLPHKGQCPAKGQNCNSCGKMNHFAKVCRSTHHTQSRRDRQRFTGNKRDDRVYHVTATTISSPPTCTSSDDEYLFSLENHAPYAKMPVAKVKLFNQNVDMVLDTGASTDIIDKATFEFITRRHPVTLQPASTRLFAYGSHTPLKTLGKFDALIESKTKYTMSTIHVTDGQSGSLLSYNTARELGLITLQLNTLAEKPLTSLQLRERFPNLFQGIGKLKDIEVKLHIDTSVAPVAQTARRLPFHMRQKVAAALDKLHKQDIIERVEGPTPYVSPLVVIPKKDGDVRLCVDMRLPNKAIQRERHPTPTVDDLITSLNGATMFSKLDLRSGYHQLQLAPESRYITTFATHKGLWRYKRLNFGTNSASEIFQHIIQQQLHGIPGVINFSDDVIVFGKTQDEHNKALQAVFEKFSSVGLTLNKDKCSFDQSTLTFFGFVFSADGVSPDPKKVSAIHNAPSPTSTSGIRSFLGMVNYCAKFIHNFSDLTKPLRALTQKNTVFNWTEVHEQAFLKIKQALTSDIVMSYFDKDKYTEVVTDASPYGLSAILSQVTPGTTNRKVVSYVSRSLTDVERRYSQTEREALAIVWAIERLHIYLYGGHFTLYTDCKPMEMILNNPKSKPSARIERWNLRLQDYPFDVVYTKGQHNPSDFLSRHPVAEHTSSFENPAVEYVNFLCTNAVPKAMSLSEIQAATQKDATLQHLIALLKREMRWDFLKINSAITVPDGVNKEELRLFYPVRDELIVSDDGNLILRGSKLVLPSTLRQKALTIAHEGHQGLIKTKKLLREKVWFPKIDELVKDLLHNCIACQANGPDSRPEPLQMTSLPPAPWHTVNIDFCGPFPTGEYLLVLIDAYSRFPEVDIVHSTSAKAVIPKLERIFATHGIPQVIKSDNGPPFSSAEIRDFLNEHGSAHQHITPLWPQANAQAENFMKPLTKAVRAAIINKQNWRKELNKFLLNYRATPHSTTGFAPATLLFNREINTKLPSCVKESTSNMHQELKKRDAEAKEKMKILADNNNHAKTSQIEIGDTVLVKQIKQNKFSSKFDPQPYVVT